MGAPDERIIKIERRQNTIDQTHESERPARSKIEPDTLDDYSYSGLPGATIPVIPWGICA